MPRKRSPKIGSTIKEYAERKRARPVPSVEVAEIHRGSLTAAKAESMARDLARPVRSYVSSEGDLYRVYHLLDTSKEFVGPFFENVLSAIRFSKALNALGEEKMVGSDGVPFGDFRNASGKRWVPTAKERRALLAAAA